MSRRTRRSAGTTETLTYDRDQAARFGIQPATIDNILYDAFGQREVAQYFTGNKAYYVILEALPDQLGQLGDAAEALRHVVERPGRAAVDAACMRRRRRCSRWRSTIRASSRQ